MDNNFKHLNNFLVVCDFITSNTLNEHRKHLNLFIETAIKEGICFSEKKVVIKKEKIKCLCFEVRTNEINLQSHISRKITKYQDERRTKKINSRILRIIKQC